MSNTGSFIQKLIDQSRGKSRFSRTKVRGPEGVRKRKQFLFERDNEVLRAAGGTIDDPVDRPKHFNKKRQKRFIKKQGILG